MDLLNIKSFLEDAELQKETFIKPESIIKNVRILGVEGKAPNLNVVVLDPYTDDETGTVYSDLAVSKDAYDYFNNNLKTSYSIQEIFKIHAENRKELQEIFDSVIQRMSDNNLFQEIFKIFEEKGLDLFPFINLREFVMGDISFGYYKELQTKYRSLIFNSYFNAWSVAIYKDNNNELKYGIERLLVDDRNVPSQDDPSQEADAIPEDVIEGKKFVAKGELLEGTLVVPPTIIIDDLIWDNKNDCYVSANKEAAQQLSRMYNNNKRNPFFLHIGVAGKTAYKYIAIIGGTPGATTQDSMPIIKVLTIDEDQSKVDVHLAAWDQEVDPKAPAIELRNMQFQIQPVE